MMKTIPLAKLVPSQRNVRRRSPDPQADLQLQADIEARGLLQNLVVTPVGKPRGTYAVEAGGRRLSALRRLAEAGKLASDHEVSCFVLGTIAEAQEASLAENFQRLSMNPADECLAFRQLVDQGMEVETIARRFGLTVRFVEGRLRLAGLAPVVFEALGAGEISLDLAKAFSATPDLERQAWVFDEVRRSWYDPSPDSVRRMMTQVAAAAGDRRAQFVGEDAYVAAGGRIERDLFAEEAAAHWLDLPLLERLAAEKLEQLASRQATELGLAWVRPALGAWVTHSELEGLRRVTLAAPVPTAEETARIGAIEVELESLAALIDDESAEEGAREAAEARVRELEAEMRGILERTPLIADDLKGRAGTFLLIGADGQARLDSAFYIDADDDVRAGDDDDDPERSDMDREARKESGLSQRLVDELSMQRRDILAVHVAADPGFALDLAIFLMADREGRHRFEKSGSSLTAAPPQEPVTGLESADTSAALAFANMSQALDRSWLEPDDRSGRFDAFRALSEDARAAWLGHAVARTLEASLNHPGTRACAFHDHLGRLLGIDVARWWRPTGSSFFDRVPKTVTLAALHEIGGEAFAARWARARKAELAQACERIFAGDFIDEPEIKEAALAWVPGPMRFGRDDAHAQEEGRAREPDVGAAAGGSVPVEAAA
ncbi:MAG: ParB N-terminal domain-containing protein [Allosphingosinicella sp.]|uniref:ParB/RepB/Spo0J family partition protein n=1 Tax=Allosphingosinicella sp. TaxID=2823234 RepID=UPI003953182B